MRFGAFVVGDDVHLDYVVQEDHWNEKRSTPGLTSEATLQAIDAAVRKNRHAETVRAAFAAGGIQCGRADFGLVGGRPQIYGINTNPNIGRLSENAAATTLFCLRRLIDADADRRALDDRQRVAPSTTGHQASPADRGSLVSHGWHGQRPTGTA